RPENNSSSVTSSSRINQNGAKPANRDGWPCWEPHHPKAIPTPGSRPERFVHSAAKKLPYLSGRHRADQFFAASASSSGNRQLQPNWARMVVGSGSKARSRRESTIGRLTSLLPGLPP